MDTIREMKFTSSSSSNIIISYIKIIILNIYFSRIIEIIIQQEE